MYYLYSWLKEGDPIFQINGGKKTFRDFDIKSDNCVFFITHGKCYS